VEASAGGGTKFRAKSTNEKIQLRMVGFTSFGKTKPILIFHSKYLGLGTSSDAALWRQGSLVAFRLFYRREFAEYDRIPVRKGGSAMNSAIDDQAIRRALESAGVEFIDENGGGPGVCLRKPVKEKPAK
jgi:hypothetical protein